jgi:transposase InsO family protein
LDHFAWHSPHFDSTWQAHAKRLHRELQWKFRDECLNEQWFQSLPQARDCIAEWRKEYNEVRPHCSLGRIPPSQFTQRQRNQFITTESKNKKFYINLAKLNYFLINGMSQEGRSKH